MHTHYSAVVSSTLWRTRADSCCRGLRLDSIHASPMASGRAVLDLAVANQAVALSHCHRIVESDLRLLLNHQSRRQRLARMLSRGSADDLSSPVGEGWALR